MEFNEKVKMLFEEYKKTYKSYWELIYGKVCKIEDDNTFMITALIRAIKTIENELKEEQENLNKKVDAFVANLKEDE